MGHIPDAGRFLDDILTRGLDLGEKFG